MSPGQHRDRDSHSQCHQGSVLTPGAHATAGHSYRREGALPLDKSCRIILSFPSLPLCVAPERPGKPFQAINQVHSLGEDMGHTEGTTEAELPKGDPACGSGHSNHSSSLPRAAPPTSEHGPKEQAPALLCRMDLGAAGTRPLHREGQSVCEGCTRRMRIHVGWWDPCRPTRCSYLSSSQLTDSP